MLHPGWLQGWNWEKPSLCIYHNSFRGLSICRTQRRCLEGEATTPYQTKEEKKEQGKARWKGVRYSWIAQCLDFLKCCSNYTLFHVLRQNSHVKFCNLFPFTTVTLRPLKKSRSWFPFNESHLAQEFSSTQFLPRLSLHRDVLVQILSFCSFRVALCLASALLTQGFLVSVSQ